MSVGGFQACQNLDLRQHEDLHAALLGQGLQLPQGLSSQVLGQLQSLYISKQVEILANGKSLILDVAVCRYHNFPQLESAEKTFMKFAERLISSFFVKS